MAHDFLRDDFMEETVEFLPKEMYKRILCVIAYAAAGGVIAYLFFRYALGALLPFILAWAVAAVLQRPVVFANKKLKIPKKLAAAVIVVAFLAALSVLIFASLRAVIHQAGDFVADLARDGDGLKEKLDEIISRASGLLEKIGVTPSADMSSIVFDAAKSAINAVASKVTSFAAGTAGAMPHMFIFAAALIISSVYFCAEYRNVADFVLKALPRRASEFVSDVKRECGVVMTKYVRAYLLLFLLTFGEVYLGLALIGFKNAFLLSLVIAFVDFLPVFGTGTVFVPWILARLILGDIRTAALLGVMYVAISIVRQFAEPKIVGGGIGLHPAVSLMAMYVGLRFFGFFGMIVAPVAAAVIRGVLSKRKAGAP